MAAKRRKRRPPSARLGSGQSASGSTSEHLGASANIGKLLRNYGGSQVAPTLVQPTATRDRDPVPRATPDAARFRISDMGCQTVRDVGPQSVGMTYWFDAPATGAAHDVLLRFAGTRIAARPDADAQASGAAEFTSDHTVRGLLPGLGRVSATVRVSGVAAGQWQVVATPESPGGVVLATGQSGFTPFIAEYAPGARIGAWPAMVSLGALLGVSLFGWLAARAGLSALTVVSLAIAACVVGLIGARVYFLAQATARVGLLSFAGMCIQGFVIGAVATLALGTWLLHLPLTTVLDITAPGLMVGMALGRLGCWWGGCCCGRLSTSRFALWSSNRYLGARRIPTQLMEGAVALLLAMFALTTTLVDRAPHYGMVLAVTLAAYIVARQLLFPLRDRPRRTHNGRATAAATASAVMVAALAILLKGHLG